MSSPAIVIIGAGVLGLSTAFELTRRGHRVTVVDPGGPNASRVAAGMVAPAMEAAIDDVSPDRAALLRAGRDLWPAFAQASGVAFARRPAEWRGGDVDGMAARLKALGFEARRDGDRVVTDEDGQIQPEQAMAALHASLGDGIIQGRVVRLTAQSDGWTIELDDRTLTASAVVLATGAGDAIPGSPEATRTLVENVQPIRGQIGVAKADLASPALRGPGADVAGQARDAHRNARRHRVREAAPGKRAVEEQKDKRDPRRRALLVHVARVSHHEAAEHVR
ncbi:FAD-binding oxidoreductase, partial [Brevundimonas sp.]|uniref:NAD(P)/FAD-dependent oxidoreductase n=1 Tax=Brevundimonas sp. TaxID=1871086 RepID=UPI0025C3B33F